MGAPAQTSATAIVSLVTGILAWVSLPIGLFLPFIVCCSGVIGIVAVVTGHMALSQVSQSNGQLTGRGLAVAGLVLGYAMLFVCVVVPICAALVLGALYLLAPPVDNVLANIIWGI
jgi:hypothetical protein